VNAWGLSRLLFHLGPFLIIDQCLLTRDSCIYIMISQKASELLKLARMFTCDYDVIDFIATELLTILSVTSFYLADSIGSSDPAVFVS
jgi:KaiC/GvpD/RAD55 family RecA-like ATPase